MAASKAASPSADAISTSSAPSASAGGVRRRGRPKKVSDPMSNQDSEALKSLPPAAVTSVRRRGRPKKVSALGLRQDSAAVESLPPAAVTSVRRRGRPKKVSNLGLPSDSAAFVSPSAAVPSPRGRGRPKKAGCQDPANQKTGHGKRQRSQLPSARCQKPKKVVPTSCAQDLPQQEGSQILPGEGVKLAVQPTSQERFKSDPVSPLFSLDGVAVTSLGELRRNAYIPFKAHFAGEPLNRNDHVDPQFPGMRASEVASVGTGLKICSDAQGAGWIASKPDCEKSASFSLKKWKSWRLAYLVAKLQRDLWWQESDSKNESDNHRTSNSSSCSALLEAGVTATPETLTPQGPGFEESGPFISPECDRLSPETFVTPVKEKTGPIPSSPQSGQSPLKTQPTDAGNGALVSSDAGLKAATLAS